LLGIDGDGPDHIYHLCTYEELFPSVELAAQAANSLKLTKSNEHIALTRRAFESTQTAKLSNEPVTETEQGCLDNWRAASDRQLSDRSIRLMMGYR
jgi:hypothetical protein